MTGLDPLVLFGIILALALNFVNGLNDASHSIATVVATKALSPFRAVLYTAVCNMIGPFLFATAVAVTIGTAIVRQSGLTPLSIVVAMGAAIVLVFVATRAGIPISSSHAMVGGLLGAGIAVAGPAAVILPSFTALGEVIVWGLIGGAIGAIGLGLFTASFREDDTQDMQFGAMLGAICGAALIIPVLMLAGIIQIGGLLAIVLFIFISPIIGIVGAFLFDILISHLFRYSRRNHMKRIFQPLHVLASLVQATAHGANDGQHAVGVITALLVSSGILLTFDVPQWVILTSAIAIGLGTCFGGMAGGGQDGKGDHEDPALPGVLCGDGKQRDPRCRDRGRHPGLIDPRDQRGDHRGRGNAGQERGAVAGGPRDDDRVDHHDPPRPRGRVCGLFRGLVRADGSIESTIFRYIFKIHRRLPLGLLWVCGNC